MGERVRFALRPQWIAGHLLVAAAAVAMVFMGRWQWRVAEGPHHGDLRNYAYALQWWLFAVFALFFWARILRDRLPGRSARTHPATPARAAPSGTNYRRYEPPPPKGPVDPVLGEYNAYLKRLQQAEKDEG